MSRAIDGDKLFEHIQKEKAWKQRTVQRPRYDKGKQDTYYEMLEIIQEQPTMQFESWIPVSERFPTKEECLKNDGRFIVTDGQRVYQSLYDIYEKQSFVEVYYKGNCNFLSTVDERVIAWQPLPEPYKEV